MLLTITFLFLVQQFINSKWINAISDIYLLCMMIILLPLVKRGLNLFLLILILISALIFIVNEVPFRTIRESITINQTLVALFISVPFLGIPIKQQVYLEALKQFFGRYMKNPTTFFLLTQTFTHIMAVILNVGAVTIFYYLSKAHPTVTSARAKASPLLRGFSTALIWSPFFAAMALVTSQLPIEWINELPFLLGFVFISFTISFLLELTMNREAKQQCLSLENKDEGRKSINLIPLVDLFCYLLLIVSSVLLLDKLTALSMVTLVILIAYVYPFIWMVSHHQWKKFIIESVHYLFVTVPLIKNEVLLFLTAGFLSGAIATTSFGAQLVQFLNNWFGSSTIGMAIFISLSVIILSICGFHPIMVITVYITSLNPLEVGMSPMFFALLLLGSWGIATSISPMTAVSHLLAHEMKEKVFNISIKWNATYSIISFILFMMYLTVLEQFNLI
ncbi:hypothetical protein ABFG93_00780 [Pseudalkalibacillus hwajinpoensis]|uniref:hypothetical protein n=1 Tax=Guptibacillus hwajinpoensis TaxID=208199 RepID=UPI00325BFD19